MRSLLQLQLYYFLIFHHIHKRLFLIYFLSKLHDVDLYDSYLLENHFSKIMKGRVENGSLYAWDVWKVVQNPMETHMLTFNMILIKGN